MRCMVAVATLLAATPALAQQMCGPADKLIASLDKRYHERPVMEVMIEGNSSPMVLYLNRETGSWTLLSVDRQSNVACIGAGGMKSRVLEALHPGEPT